MCLSPFATKPERADTSEGTGLNPPEGTPTGQESERPYERRSGVTAAEQRDAGREIGDGRSTGSPVGHSARRGYTGRGGSRALGVDGP